MKHIIHKISSRIPDKISGAERQQYIGNLVQNMPPGELGGLREEMHRLLTAMAEKNASDIDMGGVGCRGKVWYRVHGDKRPDDTAGTFTEDECDVLFHCLLMESQREYLLSKRNLDFSYMINWRGRTYRYRADLYFDLDHLALNMRYINNQIRNFKTLELHPKVVMALTLIYEKRGLTLVTGITGSGKSSTLDSIIDANNQTANAHITIIGAPIETIHKSKKSIVRHREVGRDVMSFTEGAVQALRQDPDIIVIGEMRDPETIYTALELADSGHKVFSTLHTSSAVESIDRIIAETPPVEQIRVRERLADVLKCVISQKLIPSTNGERVLAKEVMSMTASAKAATKNGNTGEIYQMMQEGSAVGMHTLEQDLKRLVDIGQVTHTEAINFANNKQRMEDLL